MAKNKAKKKKKSFVQKQTGEDFTVHPLDAVLDMSPYELRGFLGNAMDMVAARKYLESAAPDEDCKDKAILTRYGKMIAEVHDTMLQKANSKNPHVKLYKERLRDMDGFAAAIRTSLFCSVNITAGENLMAPQVVEMLGETADYLIVRSYKERRLHCLFSAIDDCCAIIAPMNFPSLSYQDDKFSIGIASDLMGQEDYERLLMIIGLTAAEPVYQNFRKTCNQPDDMDKYRLHKDKMNAVMEKVWSSAAKKEAITAFQKAAGDCLTSMLSWVYKAVGRRESVALYSNGLISKDKSPLMNSGNLLQEERSHNAKCLFDVEAMLQNLHHDIFDWIETALRSVSSKDTTRLKELNLQDFCQNDVLFGAGYYFATKSNELWTASAIGTTILLLNVRQGRGYMRSQASSVLQSYKEEQDPGSLQELLEIRTKIEPVINLFSDSEQTIFQTEEDDSQKFSNKQFLAVMGHSILVPEESLPDAEETLSTLSILFRSVNMQSDVIMGAATAAYILSNSKLIRREEAFMVPEQDQQVEDLKAQLEKAEKKIRELTVANSQKEQSIKELAAANTELTQKLQGKEEELTATRKQKNYLHEEVTELLETIESMSEETGEDVVDETEDEFPASLEGKKILAFGGFPSFLVPLQEFLPELLIYQSNRRPEAGSIKKADAVFIQTNRISHSDFYYVLDTCRENNIPVEVFKTAGAKSCAKQVLSLARRLNTNQ